MLRCNCGNTERFVEDISNYVEIWQKNGRLKYGEQGDKPHYLGHIWCPECLATVQGIAPVFRIKCVRQEEE